MKKLFIIAALAAICLTGVFAQESSTNQQEYKKPYQESPLYYRNVTVYKVLDHKDAYIVMYQKGHRDVGNIAIPKKWYKEHPNKLLFRPLPSGMTPYMTVITKDGTFNKVILTMPVSRAASVWGAADSNIQVDKDKDTLDIVY